MRLLKLLEEAQRPVSVDYVAYNLGISWVTAKALLLELVLEGKIEGIKTTKSWIFSKKNETSEINEIEIKGKGG